MALLSDTVVRPEAECTKMVLFTSGWIVKCAGIVKQISVVAVYPGSNQA